MEAKHPTAQDLERAIKIILTNYDDISREGLIDSPARILRAWDELLKADEPKITVFDSLGYDGLIVDKNIKFYSFCEHHFLPFFGIVKIGYIPDKKIIGLSKLSRIVNYYSKRLNTQEYLTNNIAHYLLDKVGAKGVGVEITARHLCKEMRGAKSDSEMITTCFLGSFECPDTQRQFLAL